MTPREKSIRAMYDALKDLKTVKVKLDWMETEFFIYESDPFTDRHGKRHPSREWICCRWHGQSATSVSYSKFRQTISSCVKIAYRKLKIGEIDFTTED